MFTRRKSKKRLLCSVHGCKSSFSKNLDLAFHQFPRANTGYVCQTNSFNVKEKIDRLKAWKQALKIKGDIKEYMKVCSLHFANDDYILPNIPTKRRRLKSTAVPSRNLPSSLVCAPMENLTGKIEEEESLENRIHLEQIWVKSELPCYENEDVSEDVNEEDNDSAHQELEIECSTFSKEKSYEDIETQVGSDCLKPSFLAFITNDAELSIATGIETLNILDSIVEIVSRAPENHTYSSAKMNLREKIVMAYVKLKQNISYPFLAILFNCESAEHCQRLVHEMLSVLSQCLKDAIAWPTRIEISKNLPKCFGSFLNVRAVLDCTEIEIQRSERLSTNLQYRNTNTCKIMIGATPAGKISFISKPCSGGTTDDNILQQSDILSCLEPGDAVMVDKGFHDIDELCERNNLECIKPPYLKDKKQFSESDTLLTANIAKARVFIERLNQRIKMFKIVRETMPENLVSRIQDIFTIICATVNLSSDISKDETLLRT